LYESIAGVTFEAFGVGDMERNALALVGVFLVYYRVNIQIPNISYWYLLQAWSLLIR